LRFGPADNEIERARELIFRFGWNTTCYQLLNPGITRWFDESREALIGFVDRNRVWVVAGAPVCDESSLPEVLNAFEAQARSARRRVCYFGAETRVLGATTGRIDHATVVLGAQPMWTPFNWKRGVTGHKSSRAQLARALNKGVLVVEWPPEKAQRHPEIARLLAEWLQTRGLPPMHFLVEPDTLGDLTGRRIFVAEQRGIPVGFLVLSPIPQRNGWLTEQFVRGFAAPNGTVELLLDTGIAKLAEAGAEAVTMGIVPLSSHGIITENPPWLNAMMSWGRAHGRRFYNFDGLDAFKSKFQPDSWEAIYAISNETQFSFRSLYAIAAAFSDGPPPWTLARAVGKAIKQEFKWLTTSGRS
jgi:phosphatidylglycerol lysyltransferase